MLEETHHQFRSGTKTASIERFRPSNCWLLKQDFGKGSDFEP